MVFFSFAAATYGMDLSCAHQPDTPCPGENVLILAQDGDTLSSEKPVKKAKRYESMEDFFSLMDQPQAMISSGIFDFTRKVDEFFSDEKIEYDTNGSFVRLTGDMIFSEGGNLGFAGDVKARVRLPHTQKKWKLVFESDPTEEREDLDRPQDSNPVDAAEEKSYFAGVEGVMAEFEHWKFRTGVGLKLNKDLEAFIRFRATRLYDISETWSAYIRNTLYDFSASQHGFETTLELDHSFDEAKLFRSATTAHYKEDNEYWELGQVFSLTQSLSERRGLIYQAGVFGISEPEVFTTDYLLQLRYRQLVHSDYLFMELSPKIVYEREQGFEPDFSFTVRFEMVFQR